MTIKGGKEGMKGTQMSERVRNLFNERAKTWSEMYDPQQGLRWRLDEFHSALARHIRPGARVLDFGCGTGNLAAHLQAHGYAMTGCDIAEQMVVEARLAAGERGIVLVNLPTDWARLPFGDGAFDGVVASSVFEYVEDLDLVWRELARVLRVGGVLIISVPNPDHIRRSVERCLKQMVAPRWVRRLIGVVPRVRQFVDYLDLSKNRFPPERWQQCAMQYGFHALLTPPLACCNQSLLLLSFEKGG
jgi:ubiquinone/menaquinone biosynthesis C-methylase UbiE